jgi:hypothetical protein
MMIANDELENSRNEVIGVYLSSQGSTDLEAMGLNPPPHHPKKKTEAAQKKKNQIQLRRKQ